jgi:hypothetical protein
LGSDKIVCDFFFQHSLDVPQPPVRTFLCEQRVVRALLHEPAAVEHEDAIGEPRR